MTTEIHKANLKFGWDLYKKLAELNRGDNVFFSPISIMAALSMTLAGARNNSELEMKQTMHLTEVDAKKLHSSVGELLTGLDRVTEGVTMSLANKLYFDNGLDLLHEYKNLLKKEYASDIAQVDFQTKFEEIRLIINKWVDDQTKHKIKDLLSSGSLNPMTRAVLVNAIYFKGVWHKQFNENDSYDGQFVRLIDDPNPLTVKFMYMKDKFNFIRSDDLQCAVLEIPFKEHSASMVIVLPYEIEGLAKLETQLDADRLEALLRETRASRKVEVEVHLPRFKLESSFNLEDVLPQLGMRDIFLENKADLSGICETEQLRISKVVHKAVIDVNEEGAEAAAATAVVAVAYCMIPDQECFFADRPFLIALKQGEVISFFGHFYGGQ